MMMIVWAIAMSSRMITLLPTSCQRWSGVALSRLRMFFSRSRHEGDGREDAELHDRHAEDARDEVADPVEILGLDRRHAGHDRRRPAAEVDPPRTALTTCWTTAVADDWLGSV